MRRILSRLWLSCVFYSGADMEKSIVADTSVHCTKVY